MTSSAPTRRWHRSRSRRGVNSAKRAAIEASSSITRAVAQVRRARGAHRARSSGRVGATVDLLHSLLHPEKAKPGIAGKRLMGSVRRPRGPTRLRRRRAAELHEDGAAAARVREASAGLPDIVLMHTGQHYDVAMNERLFADLRLPAPDLNLEVGSGTHAVQTAEVMRRFEPVLDDLLPSCVVVVGDVNSTLACSLVAGKKRRAGRARRSRAAQLRPRRCRKRSTAC